MTFKVFSQKAAPVTLEAGRTTLVLDGHGTYDEEYLTKATAALASIPKPTSADYARAAAGSKDARALVSKRREAEAAYERLLAGTKFSIEKEDLDKELARGSSVWLEAKLAWMGRGEPAEKYFDEAVYGAERVKASQDYIARVESEAAANAEKRRIADSVCHRIPRYTLGPPEKPVLAHDNGMLQNPSDPHDPNPIPPLEPNLSDRLKFAEWKVISIGARVADQIPGLSRHLPDALDAYDWFREGAGQPRTISYERFIENDPAGQETLEALKTDIEQFAAQQYAALLSQHPEKAHETVTLHISGPALSAERPRTENWQKTLGEHQVWATAEVTIHPATEATGTPTFEAKSEFSTEDRYNFNPGSKDRATGIPDEANGRFERTGLGQQYLNSGTVQRSWAFTPKTGEPVTCS